MAVTTAQIRDLLNRPKGLNEGTITEYITMRTYEVNKVARGSLYGVGAANQITDNLKENAVKFLVCVDCLQVLVDTAPTFVPQNEFRQQDIRFRDQLAAFTKRAEDAMSLISEAGGTAFYIDSTNTRQE
tara:strand:+ start:498 stop:884 length:387 start_codon:yes stop_codon:yes gene_type:complete